MTSRLPISALTDLARDRMYQAARKLAALRNADVSAQQKLDLLLHYRQDYDEQLSILMQAGVAAAQLRNYREFLHALDGGIARQRGAVEEARRQLDQGRTVWRHEQVRLNAFETLADRQRRQEMVVQNRREQRSSDEHAARLALSRRAAI